MLSRLKQRTNIYQLHPHALWHTFATQLLINDTPLHNIKTLLGHHKLDTTLIYTHISTEQLRHNIKSFSKNKTRFERFYNWIFPVKSKPINLSFYQSNVSVDHNDELQLLNDLHTKQVNLIVTGGIGVGEVAPARAVKRFHGKCVEIRRSG